MKVLTERITMKFSNISPYFALQRMLSTHGVKALFTDGAKPVASDQLISKSFEDMPLLNALAAIVHEADLYFRIRPTGIIIETPGELEEHGMIWKFACAKRYTIKGKEVGVLEYPRNTRRYEMSKTGKS